MKALVYLGIDRLELREEPYPDSGFVVRVAGCGICGTDLKTYRKGHHFFPPPAILGHEFYGIVDRAPAGCGFAPGERVVVAPYGECGVCPTCARGLGELCASKDFVQGGAFCEYVGIPVPYIKKGVFGIPAGTAGPADAANTAGPADAADVYTLVEPLACVLNGVAHLDVRPSSRVLVVGSGPMGALFALLFKARGIAVTVVEPAENRRRRVASWGIEARLPGPDAVKAGEFDRIVIAVNKAELVPGYVHVVADGGTVLLFSGLAKGETVAADAYALHYREVKLTGSFGYAMPHFHEALRLIQSDPGAFAKVITHRMPLERGAEAFGLLQSGDAFKIVLTPGSVA